MARKVLYLGDNKWCWTEECSKHSKEILLQSEYRAFIEDDNHIEALKVLTELRLTPAGIEISRYLQVQELRRQLGREPIIGLDIDNTTGDFTDGLREFTALKLKVGKDEWLKQFPEPEDYAMWEGRSAWFTDRENFMEVFQEAERSGLYLKLKIYSQASVTLNELKNYGFKIKAITARGIDYTSDTSAWLKEHSIPTSSVLHLGIAKETAKNIDIYMEDAPVVIERLDTHDKKVIVMDQTYNKNIKESDTIKRTEGWDKDTVSDLVLSMLSNAKKTAKKKN